MATQIIEIGRHRFVCGLFWQSLSRRHDLRAEAAELAARLNFDAMVLRIDRSFAGAGFASTREGAQIGLPSLGALVSRAIATEGAFYDGRQQPAPSWVGAFSLPNGKWAYFAVRDGAFLPNGDWVGTSEEVLERLHSDYSLGGWNVVIGDPQIEAQGFHNFYARSIDDMIPRRAGRPYLPRWLNLTRVSRHPAWQTFALAAAILIVLGSSIAAFTLYRRHQIELAREQAFERTRRQLALRTPHPSAAQPPAHPWASQPSPSAFVEACLDHFDMIAPGGWDLDQYVCRASNVSYSWSRADSNVAMLIATVPHAAVDGDGNHASLVEPLSLPAGGDDAIGTIRGVRLRLLSTFQMLGIPVKLTLQTAPPPSSLAARAVGQLPGEQAAPAWHMWQLEATLDALSPRGVVQYIDEPGVRIEKLSYQSGAWTLDGALYEK
ncbi:type 4b pilus protein PilO2 [Paraburkholderia sp. NMBU_R16]|uniref:type 4b pilus protein PilO2 n=1 Tax=Paraburkholderia sp. NMBU_R16 TaxID=2698676 RepID=UPI0015670FC8|nr:type 4b pilus protein PilO2 [Paraburkholderia sp. NMBU_R16]NRO98851.1 type 4b pilus protein PilO2 [Paraburkholderia sp. NMBU_R16]